MLNLLKTEWLKLKNYRAFWLVVGLVVLSYPGITFIGFKIYEDIMSNKKGPGALIKTFIGNPFAFPEAWHTVTFFSSIFIVIPAIVIIMSISNEYSYKTSRQNIIDGWSRSDFLWAKFAVVFFISLLVTVICAIVALVVGIVNEPANAVANLWEQAYYIGLFGLQTFSQLSIAFLVGLLVRKAFIALAIYFFYTLVLENMLTGWLRYKEISQREFLPMEVSDRLIPLPAFIGKFSQEAYEEALAGINIHILYTVIATLIIWVLCFYIYKKRNL